VTLLPATRLALGPVLLWQGAGVRRKIRRMPEPDGPRTGVLGAGPLCRLLILGDSSAAGVGVAHQDAALSGQLLSALAEAWRVDWRLLAQTGWTTADAQAALETVAGQRFDVAVICLGVNDATTEVPVPAWLASYAALLDRLHRAHDVRRAYACGLPPMGIFPALPQPLRWYMGQVAGHRDRALARAIAARTAPPWSHHLPMDLDIGPEDIAADGFHPGPRVYRAIGQGVAARLLAGGPPPDAARDRRETLP